MPSSPNPTFFLGYGSGRSIFPWSRSHWSRILGSWPTPDSPHCFWQVLPLGKWKSVSEFLECKTIKSLTRPLGRPHRTMWTPWDLEMEGCTSSPKVESMAPGLCLGMISSSGFKLTLEVTQKSQDYQLKVDRMVLGGWRLTVFHSVMKVFSLKTTRKIMKRR